MLRLVSCGIARSLELPVLDLLQRGISTVTPGVRALVQSSGFGQPTLPTQGAATPGAVLEELEGAPQKTDPAG